MKLKGLSLHICLVWVLFLSITQPLRAQQEGGSAERAMKDLASENAKVRYSAILDLRSMSTLPEPALKMLIDYLSDLRGDFPGNTVAGAAAELLAQHPRQAVRAIPQLLDLLACKENYGYPAGSAADALEAINRPALENHLMGLKAESRKALAVRLTPVLSSDAGNFTAWALIAEIMGMLGPDASGVIPVLEKKIAWSKREEDSNPFARVLSIRGEAALRIIRNGWRIGDLGYYEEMKRADSTLGKPDPYVTPENRFAHALETLINDMKKAGVAKAYILREESTFPFRAYDGFPPAAQLIRNTGYQFLFMGEDSSGKSLANLPLVLLTTASKVVYQSHHDPSINPPYWPRVPDFAFIKVGVNGEEALDKVLKDIRVTEGYRQDILYEFWPSQLWPTKGVLRGDFRIREDRELLWIMVAEGKVVDGAYIKGK